MMTEILAFAYENWLTILLATHAGALVIVYATPTPKDDAILAAAYKVIEAVAGVITARAKQ